MYFMGEFAKQTSQKKRTLKDRILGTTNSGRAFRIGSAISALGLTGLVGKRYLPDVVKIYKSKATPYNLKTRKIEKKGERIYNSVKTKLQKDLSVDNLRETFTKPTDLTKNKTFTRYKIDEATGKEVEIGGHYKHQKRNGFLGSKRDLKMGNILKVGGIGAGAIAIPISGAYTFGDKSDREKIQNQTNKVMKLGGKVGSGIKSTINTLHKVSR